jgi:hypothetical protein
MEIKDLAGFSQPMTKLIEVCSSGLGKVCEPYLIKKRANAKAYELEIITKALSDNKSLIGLANTTYDSGNIEIVVNKDKQIDDSLQLMQKEILEKQYYQEFKKQGNINNTINFTMNELENETKVSDEKVDEDWITRFFNTVENINNEQMQHLWAKILAGEIKQPNTYSLRTLDLLKNLSFKEAELFSKIGELALISQNNTFILSDKTILEKCNISFTDLILLQDLDLIHSKELEFSFPKQEKNLLAHIIYGNEVIQLESNQDTPKIPLRIYLFTTIGKELLELVNPSINMDYLQEIAKKIKVNENIKVLSCKMIDRKKGSFNTLMLKEV